MKKIISTVLVSLLILSCLAFVSCGGKGSKNEGEVYGKYSAAVEKTNGLKSYVSKTDSEQIISIELGGGSTVETKTTTKGTSRLKYADDGTVLSETHGTTSTDAYSETQTVEFDLFSDKDNYYYRQGGEGDYTVISKTGPDANAIVASLGSLENQKIELFGKDEIDRINVVSDNESGTTLKIVIKGKDYNEKIGDTLSDLLSSYEAIGANITRCEVKGDPECEYTISPDGYISKVSLSFNLDMAMEMSGVSMNMTLSQVANTEITEPNGNVEIEFPDVD